jgi:hypothetical protein
MAGRAGRLESKAVGLTRPKVSKSPARSTEKVVGRYRMAALLGAGLQRLLSGG